MVVVLVGDLRRDDCADLLCSRRCHTELSWDLLSLTYLSFDSFVNVDTALGAESYCKDAKVAVAVRSWIGGFGMGTRLSGILCGSKGRCKTALFQLALFCHGAKVWVLRSQAWDA